MSVEATTPPVISIVVAVRNGVNVLPHCVDSVLTQDYPFVDLVVIDGASNDGTAGLIEGYGDRIGYWLSEPDDGVYNAWNKALGHIKGDWACFLGADDRLAANDVLSKMAGHLGSAQVRVAYGVTHVTDEEGALVATMGEPWLETRARLSSSMSLPNPSVFYRRDMFEVHGHFDDRFRIAGDYEFLLRELTTKDAVFVDELVTIMGAGGLSQDPRNRAASLREAASARRLNGMSATNDWLSFQIYEARGYGWLYRLFGAERGEWLWAKYQSLKRRGGAVVKTIRLRRPAGTR